MGTTKKKDQSNASALNAEGQADKDVEVVDHTAGNNQGATAQGAAASDKAIAEGAAAEAEADKKAAKSAEAARAEEAKADVAEAKAQKEVNDLIHNKELADAAELMDGGGIKPIKYVGATPQLQARQKAELKATLTNLLAFDVNIEACSDELRNYIATAKLSLAEVNCS